MPDTYALSSEPLAPQSWSTTTKELNADFAQSVGTRRARSRGMPMEDSILEGIKSREASTDPFFELRKMEFQSRIIENAAEAADRIRFFKMKEAETLAEQRDKSELMNLAFEHKGNPKSALEAIAGFTPRSQMGVRAANEQRLAIIGLMDHDQEAKNLASLSYADRRAYKLALIQAGGQPNPETDAIMDAGLERVRQTKNTADNPGDLVGIEIQMPDGSTVQAIRNTQGKDYTVVPRKGDAETAIAAKETSKKISRLESQERELETKYTITNAEYVESMSGRKSEGKSQKAIKDKADYFRTQQMEKRRQIEALRQPASTTNAPATSSPASKIVIQNGQRFQVNADGTSTHLGPSQ